MYLTTLIVAMFFIGAGLAYYRLCRQVSDEFLRLMQNTKNKKRKTYGDI